MNEKRFKLDLFDSEVEMLELLNNQAEIISDLEKENEELKSELQEKQEGLNVFNSENTLLKKENEQLKSKFESANGEIRYCHMIIDTLVANEGVTDYNDLLNKCDKEILKDMGWEMSEKRFTTDLIDISDNQTLLDYCCDITGAEAITELLNELHDENEQLKSEIKLLRQREIVSKVNEIENSTYEKYLRKTSLRPKPVK